MTQQVPSPEEVQQAVQQQAGNHGFRGVGAFDLTPVHAVTYGQR